MTPAKGGILPLLSLPKDKVLLPGSILRIPLSNRPDFIALLSHILGASASLNQKLPQPNRSTVVVGCVPLGTAHEGTPGRKRMREEDADRKAMGLPSEQASIQDLYNIGTAATIRGFSGRGMEELALVVQGVRRFRIDSISQAKPFLEAKVTYSDKDGNIPRYFFLDCLRELTSHNRVTSGARCRTAGVVH